MSSCQLSVKSNQIIVLVLALRYPVENCSVHCNLNVINNLLNSNRIIKNSSPFLKSKAVLLYPLKENMNKDTEWLAILSA